MSPAVSVILPSYNRRDSIAASINSVLVQSFADLELIVVDDGSHDDIKSVLDAIADPRIRYIRRERNGGAAAARNTGIAAATGTFLAFQDSDDLWLPYKLERQLELFAGLSDEFGVVTSHRIIYGRDAAFSFGAEKVCVAPSLQQHPKGADQLAAMLDANRLSLPCALFRRTILPNSDWFDICARANEDWEFAVRISQKTRIYEDDRPVMLSFISADSISGSRRKQALGTLRILRANRAVLPYYPRQRAAILLDIARALSATGKPRWARLFLLQSLSTHPSATLLAGQSLMRRAGRALQRPGHHNHQSPLMLALLYAQRHSRILPPWLRDIGRRLAGRAAQPATTLAGWTTQLVGSTPLGPPPEAASRPKLHGKPGTFHANPSLRCLIVAGVLDTGGTDEVAAFLARRLPEYGFATVVAHTGSRIQGDTATGGRLPRLLKEEGIRVEDVGPAEAEQLLADWQPDVISAHCPPPWWLELASKAGVPFVETLHGMHDLYGNDWADEALRSSTKAHVIAVSELVRQQYLHGNPGFDPARITTVPNSVDPDRIAQVDRQRARDWLGLGDEFIFVSLSRYALQKNAYALLDAFGEVAERHSDVHLLLAGRADKPAYLAQIGQLRARLACRDRVHLRDHTPWLGPVLAAADAFVMNSYSEGWPLASMEALCSGLPVISTDVGGAREQVGEDGARGILIPNPLGDPLAVNWRNIGKTLYAPQANRAALVAAMSAMVEQRAAWASAREKLRLESLARFHPDHALQGHAKVLRSAAHVLRTTLPVAS